MRRLKQAPDLNKVNSQEDMAKKEKIIKDISGVFDDLLSNTEKLKTLEDKVKNSPDLEQKVNRQLASVRSEIASLYDKLTIELDKLSDRVDSVSLNELYQKLTDLKMELDTRLGSTATVEQLERLREEIISAKSDWPTEFNQVLAKQHDRNKDTGLGVQENSLDMGGNRITNVGEPRNQSDVATKKYADSRGGIIATGGGGSAEYQIHNADAKTTPADADTAGIIDSADSNKLKKVTWANIKATLKTYFDTLYGAITHASRHAVSGADTVFPADPGADRYLMWDDDPGVLVWASVAGGGDMLAATYDPTAVEADAFDVDNHVDGTTNKVYTATEKTKLAGIEALADVTDETNVQAAITAQAYVDIPEAAEPGNPAANNLRLFVTDEEGFSILAFKDSGGMVRKFVKDSVIICYNDSGDTIAALRAVYASGSTGTAPTIELAKADSSATMPAIGVTLESIANGAFGRVMQVGLLEDVNTLAFSAGDILYVSAATAGLPTTTAPTYPNIRQQLGTVIVDSETAGSIQIIARTAFDDSLISIVPSLENPPTEDLATKAPTSEWAFDHDARNATAAVQGHATAAQITKLDGIEALADVTGSHAPQAHKDSHDPNDGTDPLDTANASEIAGVQAAGTGTSHSLARADHAHQIQHGITDNHIVTVDGDPGDDEFARWTASGLEGLTLAEMLTALFGSSLPEQIAITMDDALSADGQYCVTMAENGIAGEEVDFGEVVYFKAGDNKWWLAKGDAEATTSPMTGLIITAGTTSAEDPIKVALMGKVRADAAFPALTIGAPVFISAATGGLVTTTELTTGQYQKAIGWAKTANVVVLTGNPNWVKVW